MANKKRLPFAEVYKLLGSGKISFGRSRSAQYSVCHIVKTRNPEPAKTEMISISPGEPVYVVLKSDMLLSGAQKIYSTEDQIREALSEKLEITLFSVSGDQ